MIDAPPKPREAIPANRRWNTSHLYRSDAAWHDDRRALEALMATIATRRGTLKRSDAAILRCLEEISSAHAKFARIHSYAARKNDENTKVSKYQGFKDLADKLGTALSEATAFVDPELLRLPVTRLRKLIKSKKFVDYDRYLTDLLRQKKHVLSAKEEALLAKTSLMSDVGYSAFSTLSGADLTFPKIRDEEGRRVLLTAANFSRYRQSRSRRVRKAAFDAFLGTFNRYRNTLATLLGAQINANLVHGEARRYRDSLDAALSPDEIPTTVYSTMLEAVNRHLPKLHRYLAFRRKRLGLKGLHYYDLYPPIVDTVSYAMPFRKGCDLIAESAAPLGKTYVNALKKGLSPKAGWVDVYPNAGKRSGAYMDGSVYDVHPYVLANYIDDYNSLSTVAHEMGHAMHSVYSNRCQPYPKADYTIFVAEVASTLNEALLAHHVLSRANDELRLYVLGEQLESFRQTFFRQALFSEFELAVYQLVERGEALTADRLDEIYLGIVRRYYGHDQRVVTVDEAYAVEWAYIPHFYYNYYVFQYVTGITAATALCQTILEEGRPAARRYIDALLSAGCSAPPIEILKSAGVDLTTKAPYDAAIAHFEATLDKAEALTLRG